MVDERLAQFLNQGNDWERKVTSIPGVFLLKLPAFKSRPAAIVIEVNPVDSSGSPTKKRGIIIRSSSELEQIRNILTNVKLEQLAKSIDEVNPEVKTLTAKDSSDIFQI
ncbi:MAG TPA: hypothetical protein VH415_05240 [Nitrososphaeraceae archaeon]|jgi:hypothetical protein